MRDYIEIKKDLVPYSFNILLADEWFELTVSHNTLADMYTVALRKDGALVATDALVLDTPLFRDVYMPGKFPAVTVVPYAPAGTATEVNSKTLGESVFLSIDDEGDIDG